jgi:hypothetical protein
VRVLLPEDRNGPCPQGVEGGIKSVPTVLHCSQGEQLEAMINISRVVGYIVLSVCSVLYLSW